MVMSVRKKRYLSRLLGYGVNPARVRLRTALGREQHYAIHGVPVVLPPEHNLPYYQRRDPTYDSYAIELIAALAPRSVLVVDLGANVGDTAVAMLSAGPGVRVRCVEGSPRFADYLRRNVAGFGDRVQVIERFVGPVGELTAFSEDNGTGSFHRSRPGSETVTSWITPDDLLTDLNCDVTVWKSDMDGFDIHVLVEHWSVIDERCDVLWFEFDPVSTLGDPDDVSQLARLLGDCGRVVKIYDNLGRPMLSLGSGDSATTGIDDIADWLTRQRYGYVMTPYVDVWAVRPELADLLTTEHEVR